MMAARPFESPFISSPFLAEVLSLFDELRTIKAEFNVAQCVLVTGESGSGKSALAKHYLARNPAEIQPERTFIPVLYYELVSVSTPEEFLKSLLVAIGDPQLGMGAKNKKALLDRLVILLKTTGVELLILDEVQVLIEKRSEKVIFGIADIFKDLIKYSAVPIVFMGMPWAQYLVDSNQQVAGRIQYRRIIPPYRFSEAPFRAEYRNLLALLGQAYGFSSQLKIERMEEAIRFFAATSGNLRATAELIRNAYILSKTKDRKVDVTLFAEVIRRYGVADQHNPFLLPLEKLELRELIIHSDWHFGYRPDKNTIIDARYARFGVSSDKKIISLSVA